MKCEYVCFHIDYNFKKEGKGAALVCMKFGKPHLMNFYVK